MKKFRLIIEDRKNKKIKEFVDTDTVAYSEDSLDNAICELASMYSEYEYAKKRFLNSVPTELRAEAEEYIQKEHEYAKKRFLNSVPTELRAETEEYIQKAIDKAMREIEQQEAKDE